MEVTKKSSEKEEEICNFMMQNHTSSYRDNQQD